MIGGSDKELLIDAFKENELIIEGIGVDKDKLVSRARGDDRIGFRGLIPDSKLVDFYNYLDVFVSPTWLEGYKLPIVEAMACKRPVIVLHEARIPWEVKRRCIIVEELDCV